MARERVGPRSSRACGQGAWRAANHRADEMAGGVIGRRPGTGVYPWPIPLVGWMRARAAG
jgi:hypothetical protein